MRFRDFVKFKDCYFSVLKGGEVLTCVLRYVPNGDRFKDGRSYRKVSHDEVGEYLKEFYSDGLHYIPKGLVEEHYDAMKSLKDVCERDEDVRKVADFFRLEKMGVTGSRLIGLAKKDSDVDFVLYDECFEIGRMKVKRGLERGLLEEADYERVYKKRKVQLPYDVFLIHERRKYNKAVIDGVSFDILYVGGDVVTFRGVKLGKVRVRGKVLKAHPFNYPAVYEIPNYTVLSYTHTFVGQAFEGEIIEAFGTLEVFEGRRFVIVGSRRECEDYVVSLTLLEKEGVLNEWI